MSHKPIELEVASEVAGFVFHKPQRLLASRRHCRNVRPLIYLRRITQCEHNIKPSSAMSHERGYYGHLMVYLKVVRANGVAVKPIIKCNNSSVCF